MLKIQVYTIGKNKQTWIDTGIQEYEKRLQNHIQFQWIFHKDNKQLKDALAKEKNFICLDERGKSLDSKQFSKNLFEWFSQFGSKISFVIGGATGIESSILTQSFAQISLSKLTFPHQIARFIFCEQIYRAQQIYMQTKYQK